MARAVHHVIMAGGSGTRFWPASRAARPKQFLTLHGSTSLIRQAWDRAAALSGPAQVWVAAGESHRAAVLTALPGLDPARFIAEPAPRNTAPCIGLAALQLSRIDPDAVMIVSPADHVYTRPERLQESLGAAVAAAEGGGLVTLGIKPTRPETGYGYIEVEGQPDGSGKAMKVARFVEKPDAATAAVYAASGRHLWNSGVFIWTIASIREAIRTCAPDLWSGLQRIDAAWDTPGRAGVVQQLFPSLPSISIDYAVMEKARGVQVVPADPGWSDVGSWDAVAELESAGTEASTIQAGVSDTVLLQGASRCLVVVAPGERAASRAVAIVGVSDLIVVDTPDALLICKKGESQSVRDVVAALPSRGRKDLV